MRCEESLEVEELYPGQPEKMVKILEPVQRTKP